MGRYFSKVRGPRSYWAPQTKKSGAQAPPPPPGYDAYVKMSSCGLNAGIETSAPLVSGLLNNALFHSNHTSIRRYTSNHSHPALLHDRLVAPALVINRTEVRAVRQPQIWKFMGDHDFPDYIALWDWRQRMMHRMSGWTKFAEKIVTSRIKNDELIMISQRTKSLHYVWRYQ